MIRWRANRAPLIVGLVCALGLAAWGALQRADFISRDREKMLQHVQGLGDGLMVLLSRKVAAGRVDVPAARAAIEEHLVVHPPVVFAVVQRDGETIAQVGERPPSPVDTPNLIVTDRVIWPPRHPPNGRPPPPWHWRPPAAMGAQPEWRVRVGVHARPPPHVRDAANRRMLTLFGLGGLATLALMLAWTRSIRVRAIAVELSAERREREMLTEMKDAAAGLAHETKNPIGLIRGMAQRLLTEDGFAGHALAEQIIDAADQASARLSDFIHFAQITELELTQVDLGTMITATVDSLRPSFEDADVALECAIETPMQAWCDADATRQVLINLLINSLYASDPQTTTTVTLDDTGGGLVMQVLDEGRGIPPEIADAVFGPYVTGRADGHGLGLAIVRRIVDQHRWSIRLAPRPTGGTAAIITGIQVTERN